MKKINALLLVVFLAGISANAQDVKTWSEADRQYLVENLKRTKDLLSKEIEKLSPAQANFKESPDRWSINQVVEHLAIYELIYCREVSRSINGKPQPELMASAKADDYYTTFIMEETPHVTTDFSKPFTYSVPMGNNDIKNNFLWFGKMRDESIQFIKTTNLDLRSYFRNNGADNIHQLYIYVFGHVDRHLRQIQKVKQHPKYPKS